MRTYITSVEVNRLLLLNKAKVKWFFIPWPL